MDLRESIKVVKTLTQEMPREEFRRGSLPVETASIKNLEGKLRKLISYIQSKPIKENFLKILDKKYPNYDRPRQLFYCRENRWIELVNLADEIIENINETNRNYANSNNNAKAQDIISKKTRYEFREYFVNTTLREIQIEFDAADITIDENHVPKTSGQRRSLVEQYYHTIDWIKWSDAKKILKVYENVLNHLEENVNSAFINSDWSQKTFNSLKKWIEKDGFEYKNGQLISTKRNKALQDITKLAVKFDAPELHRQIERMQNAVENDTGLVLGTAKELIETTCKTILEERGILFSEKDDLIKLFKETRKALKLVPDDIPSSAKGKESIQKLLGSLGTIVQGLAELRNLYGTGHGKTGKSQGLPSRHAKLAAGSAASLATFLFETHQERNIQ
jgi:hypothetical protein